MKLRQEIYLMRYLLSSACDRNLAKRRKIAEKPSPKVLSNLMTKMGKKVKKLFL